MANWLQKFLPPPTGTAPRNLPVKVRQGQVTTPKPIMAPPPGKLPNAALIYGIAAAALIAVSLIFLFTGRWITALLVMLPAGCFLGYALHFTKYYSNTPGDGPGR